MSPTPESLQERYAAIEGSYAQQNWPAVEADCEALLAELPDDPDHPLRQRLHLLLGHTQLYGNADPAAAARHYSTVLAINPEPVLRDIAEQGLQLCSQAAEPEPRAQAPSEPAPEPAAAAEAAPSAPGGDAMPWLQELKVKAATPTRAAPIVEAETAAAEVKPPASAPEEPPLEPFSPEELEELARGLLKVVIS